MTPTSLEQLVEQVKAGGKTALDPFQGLTPAQIEKVGHAKFEFQSLGPRFRSKKIFEGYQDPWDRAHFTPFMSHSRLVLKMESLKDLISWLETQKDSPIAPL